MPLGFTDDQLQFRDVVARFLKDKSPPSAVRSLMATPLGYDTGVWQQLAQEVGLLGTHFPEAYGGFGFGPVELGLIAEEMGRHLYCGPFFASAVMAGYALVGCAEDEHKERLLPSIAAGTTIATLALDDVTDPRGLGHQLKSSAHSDGGTAISGVAPLVIDAQAANVFIVLASTHQGLALFEVDPHAAAIQPLEALDPTRKLSRVTFDNAPAVHLGNVSHPSLMRFWDQACTMLAHEMVGGADRLYQSTIEYMKMRVQFGRAIGSFQALKHRCADLLLELELAKAMAYEAARYLATGEGDHYSPNMAKALASDAYTSVAKQAIQLRGGIGFTWEEDTHLWFKRAKASEVFLGTSNWHREQMMVRVEAQANG